MVQISGVIHTYNEEKNIANAIRSLLPWVSEVVVIDMHSEDRTREIAESLGARIVLHERLQFADPARDFGIAQTCCDWIITIDAYEMVPAPLALRLCQIAESDSADVVMIFFHDFILGSPFAGAGWGLGHEFHPRFFRKGAVRFPPYVHAHHEFSEAARVIRLEPSEDLAIVHFNYRNAEHVLYKLNRYTQLEAEGRRARGVRCSEISAVRAAVRSFASRYLYRRGYRLGWRGLFMCTVMVMYEIAAFTKQIELEEESVFGPVEDRYAAKAASVLEGFRCRLET